MFFCCSVARFWERPDSFDDNEQKLHIQYVRFSPDLNQGFSLLGESGCFCYCIVQATAREKANFRKDKEKSSSHLPTGCLLTPTGENRDQVNDTQHSGDMLINPGRKCVLRSPTFIAAWPRSDYALYKNQREKSPNLQDPNMVKKRFKPNKVDTVSVSKPVLEPGSQ